MTIAETAMPCSTRRSIGIFADGRAVIRDRRLSAKQLAAQSQKVDNGGKNSGEQFPLSVPAH